MAVCDLKTAKVGRQGLDVERRIASRPRERPHVEQQLDLGLTKHCNDLVKRPIGVTDRRE
jgi:hypothetical protein